MLGDLTRPLEIHVPIRRLISALITVVFLAACAGPQAGGVVASEPGAALTRSLTVYRSPDCSCCHLWAGIASKNGWSVAMVDQLDMATFKSEAGVPAEYASCHTTLVDGYFIEGHVPLAAVEKLLADHPNLDGIALPGMPAGSPGMGGLREGPLEILAIHDGAATAFGSY
jgi:hypothetical protein